MISMIGDNVSEREELLRRLKRIGRSPQNPRSVRLLTHPYKMLYPKLLTIAHKSKEVKAKTFWGGEMNVILPEIVSKDIWRYGFFEADVCFYLLSFLKEGMSFIDIGGHFGFFSLMGSYLVGEKGMVLTFEPTPSTFTQLKKNVLHHAAYQNIELNNMAAYSSNTDLRFYDYGLEFAAFNSLYGSRDTQSEAAKKEILVKACRLDDVLEKKGTEAVDFVKIDAESSEMRVLNGMVELLKRYKPFIVVEVGDFNIADVPNSKEIISWLQGMKYMPYEVAGHTIVPHTIREKYACCNLLFIPV